VRNNRSVPAATLARALFPLVNRVHAHARCTARAVTTLAQPLKTKP
jgi:hypothetical protein